MEPRLRNKYSPVSRYSNHKYESLLIYHKKDKVLRRSESRPKSRMDTEESSAPKYLQMMQTFDSMVQSFENPEILNTSYEDRSRNQTQPHKTPCIVFSSKLRIKRRANNEKSATKTHFPPSRRFKNYLDNEETMGPGSYFKPVTNISPSFKFSSSPRMEDSVSHRMAEFSRILRSQTPSAKDHLERNIQFACINKEAMMNSIHRRAKINKEKVEHVLHQKQKIILDKLTSKQERIYQKFQKFEWRKRKEEFVQVRRSWSDLSVICAMSFVLFIKLQSWRVTSN